MESDIDDYQLRIKKLEDETAHYSEQSLLERENWVLTSLREITQNIMAMEQENSLVEIKDKQRFDGEDGRLMISLEDLQDKISMFEELVRFLKVSHLEQEALDNFLRHTISSSNLLQLKSMQDTKYVDLESQVKDLEQGTLETHRREIEATKDQIKNLCKELTTQQDTVNMTFLETSNALEQCDLLLDELTHLRMEKQTSEEADTIEEEPVSQTYQDWESLQKTTRELNAMEDETSRLKSSILSYENPQMRSKYLNIDDPQMIQKHKALELFVQVWITKFISLSGVSLVELFPQTRKFQFDVETAFRVVITLATDSSTLRNIEIYRKETGCVFLDLKLSDGMRKEYLGSNNIYNGLNGILHMLESASNEDKRASH